MGAYQTRKAIAKGWIKKGDQQNNVFDMFISYWIAFNCFYHSRTGKERDSHAIAALTKDMTLVGTFKGTINAKTLPFFNTLKDVCPIYKVSDPSKSKNISSVSNFGQVVKAIYQIRCNLVHGDKGEEVARDKKVVKAATPVLEIIVKELVNRHF